MPSEDLAGKSYKISAFSINIREHLKLIYMDCNVRKALGAYYNPY